MVDRSISRSVPRRGRRSRSKRLDKIHQEERHVNRRAVLTRARNPNVNLQPKSAARPVRPSSSPEPNRTRPSSSRGCSPSVQQQQQKKPLPTGIVRSVSRGNKYFVKDETGTEYEVQTPFYCTLCNAQLYASSFDNHAGSKKHVGRVAAEVDDYEDGPTASKPSDSLQLAPAPAQSQFIAAGYGTPPFMTAPATAPPTTTPPPLPLAPAPVAAQAPGPTAAQLPQHFPPVPLDRVQQHFQEFMTTTGIQQITAALPQSQMQWNSILENYFRGPGSVMLTTLVQQEISTVVQQVVHRNQGLSAANAPARPSQFSITGFM